MKAHFQKALKKKERVLLGRRDERRKVATAIGFFSVFA